MVTRKTQAPRGMLRTAAADPGRIVHMRYHPSDALAGYVEHYWSVRWRLEGHAPHRAETLPHPSVHVVFENGIGRIGGVARGKFSRLLTGDGGVIAVKFIPGAFQPFLGAPMSTIAGKVIGLGDLWGAPGEALGRAVSGSDDDMQRIPLIEDFLLDRLPAPDDNVALVAKIVGTLMQDRTIVSVDDVVDRFGMGKRALQRLFAKYVGVNPKWVIQRYRLLEAAELLATDASIQQSALALALGYADQAHFVRDFKAMVGVSPAAYAKRARSPKA